MAYRTSPVAAPIEFETIPAPGDGWDRRVAPLAGAGLYHRAGWATVWRSVYRHRALGLIARREGVDVAALLVIRKPSLVRGRHWVAMPYFDAAPPVGEEDCAVPLIEHAAGLAREDGARFLEVRSTGERDWGGTLDKRKSHVLLDLPDRPDAVLPALPKKVRSQVRRGLREEFAIRIGGSELVDGFYGVYSEKMRELGSPAHGAKLFRAILEAFPDDARIVVLEKDGATGSAAFLLRDGTTVAIPWAATRSEWNRLSANMVLYHACLEEAVRWGGRRFDFGRGDAGSSHLKFKLQWGGVEERLHWYRFPRSDDEPGAEADEGGGRALRLVSSVWRKLPLGVTRRLGPLLVRQFS